MEVQIFPDFEILSRKAAELFVEISGNFIVSRGRFIAAVSGGSTPKRLYALLGSNQFGDKIDWRHVHFFLVDERFVSSSHKDSNYRLLNENLLSKISISGENVHPVNTDVSSPEISAKKYEEYMRKFFGLSEDEFPEFDLIVLGIGEDGHTASLFPGSAVLKEKRQLACPVNLDEIRHDRITLTLPVINNAKNVVFLASGKNKAAVIKKVVEQRDNSLPASMVNPERGRLLFMLDYEASLYLESVYKLS